MGVLQKKKGVLDHTLICRLWPEQVYIVAGKLPRVGAILKYKNAEKIEKFIVCKSCLSNQARCTYYC